MIFRRVFLGFFDKTKLEGSNPETASEELGHTKPIARPQFSGSLRKSTICLLASSEK